ncbi:MAG TPA: DUF6152 family protein [Rhizobiaceae bacterium]|nr:DUF6152 family protein [Rhizobiaceae bacterium]
MKKLAIALSAASTVLVATAALAHHSFSMFDPSKEIVVKGVVARWAYNSPHTFMMIKDEEGKLWAFEGAAPPALLARTPAISGDTFKNGQTVSVIVCPLRDGRNGGAAGLFFTDDGTVYNPSDAGCSANQRIKEWTDWLKAGHKSKAEAEAGK